MKNIKKYHNTIIVCLKIGRVVGGFSLVLLISFKSLFEYIILFVYLSDYCVSNPCLNCATCTPEVGKYSCGCNDINADNAPKFSGDNCEVRPPVCVAGGKEDCQNTGECFNNYRDRIYSCVCKTGYKSKLCCTNLQLC